MQMSLSAMVRYLLGYMSRAGFVAIEMPDDDLKAPYIQRHVDLPLPDREYQDFDKWCDANLSLLGDALLTALPKKVQHMVILTMPEASKVIEAARHQFDGICLRGLIANQLSEPDSDGIVRPIKMLRFDIAYREAA